MCKHFKVQNVHVEYPETCKTNAIIEEITSNIGSAPKRRKIIDKEKKANEEKARIEEARSEVETKKIG